MAKEKNTRESIKDWSANKGRSNGPGLIDFYRFFSFIGFLAFLFFFQLIFLSNDKRFAGYFGSKAIVYDHKSQKAAVDNKIADFKDNLVIYDKKKDTLEIGFFRTVISQAEKKKMLDDRSLLSLLNKKPDFVASFLLSKGAKKCSVANVRSLTLYFYKDGLYFDFPSNSNFQSFLQPVNDERRQNLLTFSCNLGNNEPLEIIMKGNQTVRYPNVNVPFAWNISSYTTVNEIQTGTNLVYNSKSATETFALYTPGNDKVQVGFFGKKIDFEQKLLLKKSGSLLGLSYNRPHILLEFLLEEYSDEFTLENIKSRKITFLDDKKIVELPKGTEKVSFQLEGTRGLSGASGNMLEGEEVKANLKSSATRVIEGEEVEFLWNIGFKAQLNFAGEDYDTLDEQRGNQETVVEDSLGYLKFEESVANFKSTVSFFDPNDMTVKVGFFVDSLSESEKLELRESNVLSAGINGKKPNLILLFQAQSRAKVLDLFNAKDYIAQIIRDDNFKFPGQSNAVRYERDRRQLRYGGLARLNASLDPVGEIKASIFGNGTFPGTTSEVNWAVKIDDSLLVIK